MPLRIGLHAGPQDCTYEDLKRLWHIADSSGFYWISVWDHFYENPTIDGKGPCFEGITTMAALAAETSNVRVGCLVFCMGYRNPALFAKSAVTIDHISNGRLELGIGAGWYDLEYRAYGYPFPPIATRMDMLEEGVQIIRSMFTDEETTFIGEHYRVEKAYCFPRPVQKPPRIWLGGIGEKRTLRIAARYAGGWNAPYISPQVYKAKSQVLDRWCEVEKKNPADIQRSVNVGFYMGADEAAARRKRQEFEEIWKSEADADPGGMLLGTASEAIEQMGAFVDAGVTDLNIALRAPYDFDALQSFIEDVMPAFKD
ncbi:MAG: TIGR03560 family F420-dependent LLM class oxidoreductase [Dehalococcoidia bacterium]